MEDENELLDIVDVNDQVIGTIRRGEYDRLLKENLGYLRAIDVFLVNGQGKIWVPKRPPHKKIAPNGLDYSCGGHVASGETYLESALREISEELSVDLDEKDLEFVKIFHHEGIRFLQAVYLYYSDEVPDYNPDDFVSWEWLTPKELLAKLDSGIPAKSSIRPTVAELLRLGVFK